MSGTRFQVTPSPPTLRLDILIYKDGDCFVAHCLQLDIVHSSYKGMDVVFEEAMDICTAHVLLALEEDRLDSLFRPPDPRLVSKMFRAILEGTLEVHFRVRLDDDEIEYGIEFQRLAA